MKMKVKDIIKVIEDFAPLSVQEGWDNSGLCVGSPEDEVTSVLLALDCTPALVDEAVACGADMIVTHHPLIFSGLKKISPEDMVGKKVIVVANLAPAKLCGVESEGMLLASGEEEVRVIFLDPATPLGERVR